VTTPLPREPLAVRVAGGDDWAVWRTLRLRALRESPGAYGSTYAQEAGAPASHWQERLEREGSVSVLAFDGDRPVAVGAGYPDLPGLLHVVAMWVDPSWRGRGVAHAVLRALEEWATGRGLRLHLDVSTGNAAARRSYERYGFVATGETRPLREGSEERVERMVLSGTRGSR
jgi:GNAT superfamily N-acetyltransferase